MLFVAVELEAEDERIGRGEKGVLGYGGESVSGRDLGGESAPMRDDWSRIVA